MTTAERELTDRKPLQSESQTSGTMKALVYHGPGKRAWEEKPRPTIKEASDAIVRITTSTICGTDLHILKGDLPTVTDGRILGHEGIGIVESVGPAVSSFRASDQVLISCVTACGKCDFCRKSMYSHCRHGGPTTSSAGSGASIWKCRVCVSRTSKRSACGDWINAPVGGCLICWSRPSSCV